MTGRQWCCRAWVEQNDKGRISLADEYSSGLLYPCWLRDADNRISKFRLRWSRKKAQNLRSVECGGQISGLWLSDMILMRALVMRKSVKKQ